MKRQTARYFLFLVVFFALITLLKKWFSLSYWTFWAGGVAGIFFPAIDHILYVYLLRPYELTSQRVQALFKQKKVRWAISLLYDTVEERTTLVFHTAFFQVIFLVLTFLIVFSSGSRFGRGLVVAASLHLLIDQLDDLLKKDTLDGWFGANPFMNSIFLTKEKATIYWLIILGLTLLVSLFL
jgi:hypothetical protein